MSTLLHIDSNPLYSRSVSRELTAAFVTQWKASHPEGRVVERDLSANAEWIGAVYTPEEARTPQQKELLSLSDSLLAELEQADEYVFGVPMHNFGVPSALKLWIDQIARVGRTFPTRTEGRVRTATFFTAGGTAALNQGHDRSTFLAPHLQAVQAQAQSLEEVAA